ncbi:putative 39S ribosomal protein L45 mitochondrial-like, partial [Trifolium pratense]
MSLKRLQLARTLFRSSQIQPESSSNLFGSCRSYSNALTNGSDCSFKSFHPNLFKGNDGFSSASVKNLTLRSTMAAECSNFMNDRRMSTAATQRPSAQVRGVHTSILNGKPHEKPMSFQMDGKVDMLDGAQIAVSSPGFIYEPYEPREKIPFWRRMFTRSGWKRTKDDMILELKNAYAIAKLRKTGYSKKQFYREAVSLYKE